MAQSNEEEELDLGLQKKDAVIIGNKGEPDHEMSEDTKVDDEAPGMNENNDEKNEEKEIKENNSDCPKIKILFLDIDGVMNGSKEIWDEHVDDDEDDDNEQEKSKEYLFRPERVNRLKEILKQTKCKVVLSTAWRRTEQGKKQIEEDFIKQGIEWDDIYIGDTPILDYHYVDLDQEDDLCQRTLEIDTYLKSIEDKYIVLNWCAVDDMRLDYGKKSGAIIDGHFVMTDGYTGMTDSDVLAIIKILNK